MAYELKPGDTKTSAKGFFYKEGRVLLVKPTGSEDRYDIPGGKIKFSESKEQGLYRECMEEVGLRIKKAELLGEDTTRDKVYFVITEWTGDIVLQEEEIEKYRWVEVEKVSQYYLTKTAYVGLSLFLKKNT
jgi:8-oxo-dGTP pyrophosphatase MutT (NUDIX family)